MKFSTDLARSAALALRVAAKTKFIGCGFASFVIAADRPLFFLVGIDRKVLVVPQPPVEVAPGGCLPWCSVF
jgi:hypothetical protein